MTEGQTIAFARSRCEQYPDQEPYFRIDMLLDVARWRYYASKPVGRKWKGSEERPYCGNRRMGRMDEKYDLDHPHEA